MLRLRRSASGISTGGVVLLEGGRIFDAIKEYHKALKYNPDDPQVLNNLGYAYAKTGGE